MNAPRLQVPPSSHIVNCIILMYVRNNAWTRDRWLTILIFLFRKVSIIDWLSDFNDISTHQRLFYAKKFKNPFLYSPVNWGCRTHRLHHCRGVKPHPSGCPVYDIKQFDGEAPVMPEFGGMWSTPTLPPHTTLLWLGEVAPERILSMGQIKLFDI